jgi:hypothetical protein
MCPIIFVFAQKTSFVAQTNDFTSILPLLRAVVTKLNRLRNILCAYWYLAQQRKVWARPSSHECDQLHDC